MTNNGVVLNMDDYRNNINILAKTSKSLDNILKIERLANELGLLPEEISSFSDHERFEDYLSLSISFGFDLTAFYERTRANICFRDIATSGGFLELFYSLPDCDERLERTCELYAGTINPDEWEVIIS